MTLARLIVIGLVAATGACGPVPQKSKIGPQAQPEFDWREALWPHVTAAAGSGPAAECQRALTALESEARCRGTVCRFGAELANQWLTRCAETAPKSVTRATQLQTQLKAQLDEPRTDCGTELDQLFGDVCKKGTCPVSVQDWATRCGETEAGPLGLAMVQRTFAGTDEGADSPLDARSCDTMRAALHRAGSCKTAQACQQAWQSVLAYRKRCEYGGKPPDLFTAVSQLTIAYRAGHLDDVVTLPPKAALIYAGRFPLTHADGKGVILAVCDHGPPDPATYLAARAACPRGKIDLIRMVTGKDGTRHLRIGTIPLPTPAPLTNLYPWLAVVDEQLLADERALPSLSAGLDVVLRASKGEVLAELIKLFDTHAGLITRSYDAQQLVTQKDVALVRTFEALAQAKLAGAPPLSDLANRWGMVHRAKRRPFADMDLTGKVSLGVATQAHTLDMADVLPKSMAAYHQVMGHLFRGMKFGKKPTKAQLELAQTFGDQRATKCRGLLIKLRETQRDLQACALQREACTAQQRQSMAEEWKKAHAKAVREHHQLDIALSIVAGGDDKLTELMSKTGCVLP
ncbi:MAG: hypothetical protein JRI68_21790 [Deltaproteobacteria bacterium]|nr:hypothetical protein [Deltaproteobacteria bacterium]